MPININAPIQQMPEPTPQEHALAYLEARIGKLEAQVRELLAAPEAHVPQAGVYRHDINPATGQTESVELPLGPEAVQGLLPPMPVVGSVTGRTRTTHEAKYLKPGA